MYCILFQLSPDHLRLSDFEDESCDKKIIVESFTITREINSTIESLIRPESPEIDLRTEMDFHSMQQQSTDVE